MKEKNVITPLLQYPYVNELGNGCKSVVKRNDLYVQCNKSCDEDYCKICKLNLNLIDVKHRIISGFDDKTPNQFNMVCYKKIMKKMGETISSLKKQAKSFNLTLNMNFVEEMCKKKKKKTRKKKDPNVDISIVSDSDEETEPRVVRGRGRPKNINNKDSSDLMNELMHGTEEEEEVTNCEEENEDDEIIVEPFDYNGDQEKFKGLSLYKDENNIIYNNLGEVLGNYYSSQNVIEDLI